MVWYTISKPSISVAVNPGSLYTSAGLLDKDTTLLNGSFTVITGASSSKTTIVLKAVSLWRLLSVAMYVTVYVPNVLSKT